MATTTLTEEKAQDVVLGIGTLLDEREVSPSESVGLLMSVAVSLARGLGYAEDDMHEALRLAWAAPLPPPGNGG